MERRPMHQSCGFILVGALTSAAGAIPRGSQVRVRAGGNPSMCLSLPLFPTPIFHSF